MSDFDTVIAGIQNKVRKLMDERRSLQTELEQQKEHCRALQEALENQNIILTNLKAQSQTTNQGNTLAPKGDSTEIKSKINQLIQTIDESLTLLSAPQ